LSTVTSEDPGHGQEEKRLFHLRADSGGLAMADAQGRVCLEGRKTGLSVLYDDAKRFLPFAIFVIKSYSTALTMSALAMRPRCPSISMRSSSSALVSEVGIEDD
jgi:hypothetical protein